MAASPLTYYAQFRNADGSLVTAADGRTWFAVQGVGTDSIAASQSGTGRLAFGTLQFGLGDDPALATLFAAETSRRGPAQVELAGYGAGGLVTDTIVRNVSIVSDSTQPSGAALSLGYTDEVQAVRAGGRSTVAGWNIATNRADTSAPFAAPAAAAPAAVPLDPPLTWVVQFRTLTGVLAGPDGQSWFALDGDGVSLSLEGGSGSAGQGGLVLLDPASFTVPGAALPVLLAALGAGQVLTVEAAGYDGTGITAARRSDIVLKSARIDQVTTQGDGSQSVGIVSSDVVRIDSPAAGEVGLPRVAGWNADAQTADGIAVPQAPAIGVPQTAGAPALTYQVRLRAGTRLLQGDDRTGWFAVRDLATSAAVADDGTVRSIPLSFSLGPDRVLAALLDQEIGQGVLSVEVAGYDASGTLRTDDLFSGTLGALSTGADGRVGVALTCTQESGRRGAATGAPAGPVFEAPPVATAVRGAGPALAYHVQFRDAAGTVVTDAAGQSWFAASGTGFAISAGQGGLDAEPAGFTLAGGSILATLAGLESRGATLQTVELAGYDGDGTLVSDDLLKGAQIDATTLGTDGSESVTLSYAGVLETAIPSKGMLPVLTGYNFAAGRRDVSTDTVGGTAGHGPDAPASGVPAEAATPPLACYVSFETSRGSLVADALGNTWFGVAGLSLGTSPDRAAPGSLAPTEAMLRLTDPLLQPLLTGLLSQGAVIDRVTIAAYPGSGVPGSGVASEYAILGSAVVASVSSGGSLGYDVGLSGRTLSQVSTLSAKDPGAPTPAARVAPVSDGPLSSFLAITPGPGGSLDPRSFHQVGGVGFGTALQAGGVTAGGAPARDLAPLSVTLAPDPLLSTLLAAEGARTVFRQLELASYAGSVASPVLAADDAFVDAQVSSITLNADGSETVVFSYAGREDAGFARTADGGLARAGSGTYDPSQLAALYAQPFALPDTGPACYCRGTRIAVPGGERAVESLAAGELVLAADGRALPVVWVGRRSYRGRLLAGRRDVLPVTVLPVTIRAGALGGGVPHRDLSVSPEHALLLDGMLIPARALVNATSVTQAAHADEVHYFHVELASHEAILAEGAAAESFVDDDSRGAFHNAGEHPGPRRTGPATFCAPRVEDGHEVEAVRRRIAGLVRRAA